MAPPPVGSSSVAPANRAGRNSLPPPPGGRGPLPAGDVPLLTHDETGATSVARASGVAVAARPVAPPAPVASAAVGAPPPRGGTKRASKRTPLRRRLRLVLFSLLGLAVLGPVLAFVVGWMIFKVPTADDAAITQVATFTFAGGEDLAVVRPENVNRVKVTLDRVPKENVINAVLAAEDSSFYSNPGFDITGIGRAIYNQLTGGVGGGSTITQQYVKVSTDEREPTLWRKYKEVVLAVKISKELQKDQILENYLNIVYFGRGAYGIQAASQAYFGKDVEDLTVSEGAMLAGIIQSPSSWDPAKSADQAQRRWNFVLDQMVDKQWLDPTSRAQQAFPDNWLPKPPELGGVPDDDRYHIYNRARVELEAQGITEDQINTEGLVVTTTVDSAEQRKAVQAVNKVLKGQPKNLRAALVSVDPKTGAILVLLRRRQGSGYRLRAVPAPARLVVQAVRAGRRPSGRPGSRARHHLRREVRPVVPGGVTISNSEGFDCDRCDVKTAMTKSINTVFYKMALDTGLDRVITAAHQAGIPGDLLPDARGGIALGDQEVRPLDMASAFGTFAADGQYHPPFIVAKVVSSDGRVLIDRTGTPSRAPGAPPCRRRWPATSPSRCWASRAAPTSSSPTPAPSP